MNQELIIQGEDPTFKAALTVTEMAVRRQEFAEYVKTQMKDGVDFGVIPGTDKPTLLQPGADKLLNLYALTSRLEIVKAVEVWDVDSEFFFYVYRCSIIWPRKMLDGTIREEVIAQGEGSCNSREKKFGWRWVSEENLTPAQKAKAAAGELKSEGKPQFKPHFTLTPEQQAQGAAEKWKTEIRKSKKGSDVLWMQVPSVLLVRVPNDEICDLVNTIQKMAQKRAYVGATIRAVKASDTFTQDMEDLAAANVEQREHAAAPAPVAEPAAQPAPAPKPLHEQAQDKAGPHKDLPKTGGDDIPFGDLPPDFHGKEGAAATPPEAAPQQLPNPASQSKNFDFLADRIAKAATADRIGWIQKDIAKAWTNKTLDDTQYRQLVAQAQARTKALAPNQPPASAPAGK